MGLFPGQNPNPVLRMDAGGILVYGNAAAAPITEAWGVEVGERLPAELVTRLRSAASESPPGRIEVASGRRPFDVLSIRVPQHDFWNLYGTDITAAKVVERFPDRNPNPVLRMTPAGVLWYSNEASRPLVAALGARVGEPLPDELVAQLQAVLANPRARTPE